uniref:ABC transporter n=1 Tax=Wuchereria bancrofti TaxID=6293 RepID=A0A1I8EXT5_WUCBA
TFLIVINVFAVKFDCSGSKNYQYYQQSSLSHHIHPLHNEKKEVCGGLNGLNELGNHSNIEIGLHLTMGIKKRSNKSNESWSLYSFADKVDIQLMVIGLILALVQAILLPFVWLVMGDFVSLSIVREQYKMEKTKDFESFESNKIGIGLNSSNSFDQFNFTSLPDASVQQSRIDAQFEYSATPAFIMMLSLSVATFIAAFFQRLAWEVSGIRQVFRVKKAYIRKLLHMDVAWLESRHSGQVASMLHDHADSIYQGIADHVPMVIFICAYLLVTSSVCFYIQWDVTLVMFAALPLLIGTRLIFSKWFCKTRDEEQKLLAKMTNLVQETFSCIRAVIAFAAQKQTISKYERLTIELNRMTEQRLTASSIYDALAQVLLTEFIFTAALCYGMWRVNDANPGRLAALAINMLYMCVTSISIGFHMTGASTARQNANEMNAILIETPNIECYINKHSESMLAPRGNGAIEFKDISFAYPSRPDIEVLKGVSFTVSAGEHVAIVGPSGSGKSTITALMLRFYDPTNGTITLDGVNLKLLNPDNLRAQLGLVSQEPVLFDGTISDNIRYGRLNATQAEINDAARKAEAWQFICALPEGMKTRVGDRGLQLSGGQKQRVAIARAVIRDPSVMIFDEATSALDTKHEVDVQKAIDAASQGVTTITIAHRLSTVRNADRIIVLESGQIVEEGSPEELLANRDGKFHRMYNDQKFDSLAVNKLAANPRERSKVSLAAHFSMMPSDFIDAETYRRAWARSSLGAHKRLGKSYSVLSTDREKLALPVMSKKRNRMDTPFKTNIMEIAMDDKDYDDENSIALVSNEETAQRVFITAAVYTALIIIKTMFEAVGLSMQQRLFIALYGNGFCGYLRNKMFRKILRHGAAYFDEEANTPGRLTLGDKLDLLLPAVICSTVSVTIALLINWKLALICGFQFPAFFIFRLVELRETSKRQRQMAEQEKKAANLATAVLSNMSTIKAYTLQEHFNNIFYETLKPLQKTMKRQSCISSFVFACQFSFTYILIAITLHFGKVMMLSNEITPFDYLRVVLLTQFGANFISQLIASVNDISKARVASGNILNVIKETAVDMNNLSDEGLRPKTTARLMLKNVEFRYPSRPLYPVLRNLTLKVRPGDSIAIVGPSGSGKSSILALFQRMYSTTKGEVLIDNYNVKQINPAYLRRVVVSVGQEPILFSFTIRENIGYGLPEDEATEKKIIEAAKIANIHDFILSLPQVRVKENE